MATTLARKEDLEIKTETVVFNYLNGLVTKYETVCKTSKETFEFLCSHNEFITEKYSCICDVNENGDLIVWSPDYFESFKNEIYSKRKYDLDDEEIKDLIVRGLTFKQARRYAMHKAGMSFSEIATLELIKRAAVQDSIEASRKKIE